MLFRSSVNTNNTTGFIDPTYLEYSTFGGYVHVNTLTGVVGTAYPIGTPSLPCSNIDDAHIISTTRGINDFFIAEDITLTSESFSHGHGFYGRSIIGTTITLQAGTNVDNCTFHDCKIIGILDNNNVLEDCVVDEITSFDGDLFRCGFREGGIMMGGVLQTAVIDCFSEVAGTSTPFIDISSGAALIVRGYIGGLELRGKTGTDACSVDILSGQVIIASSCVAGTITIRGNCEVTDNSGAGCTVLDDSIHTIVERIDSRTGLDLKLTY